MSNRRQKAKRAGEGADPADPQNREQGGSGPDRCPDANSDVGAPQAPRLQRIIRAKDLPRYVGLRNSQIAVLIAEGRFPRPIKLSDRAVGWLELELAEWQEQRRRERGNSGRQP